MTASDKLFIIHLEERICGGQELWVEHNLGREGGRDRGMGGEGGTEGWEEREGEGGRP